MKENERRNKERRGGERKMGKFTRRERESKEKTKPSQSFDIFFNACTFSFVLQE